MDPTTQLFSQNSSKKTKSYVKSIILHCIAEIRSKGKTVLHLAMSLTLAHVKIDIQSQLQKGPIGKRSWHSSFEITMLKASLPMKTAQKILDRMA